MAKIRAVAIERQYCSGGREIAKLAAEQLGIVCYDKELAQLTAERLGVTYEEITKYEETLINTFLSPISFKSGIDRKQNMSEIVFEVQADIITNLVKKEPCVIVGRCADFILKNNVPTLSVFVCSGIENRMQHAMDCHGIEYESLQTTLKKMDKKRSDYYKLNTQKTWDSMLSYDLCLNSGRLGFEGAARIIAEIVSNSK
ncbi:MAG: cytidylate kinase-like family protein [Ruminococcus sp.]|nr:cytidylate kinase-like family protein [Ruminococcus sp.]